jgi:hypothetical protein
MLVVFRPEALNEAISAQSWYESRSIGLGSEFARAVDASASLIECLPTSYPIIRAPYRHCVLRRFPYSLIYRTTQLDEAGWW